MNDKKDAGLHIILDGFVKDQSVFEEKTLQDLFNKLVNELEMKIILGPTFLEVELDPAKLKSDVFQDEGGITGMCVISTSHISIHCWPLRKCFSMDIFSCKNFDHEKAIKVVDEILNVEYSNITKVTRNFP